MAGGPSSIDLVVACSESGALGSIGGAYLPPDALEQFIIGVQEKTSAPINVNLFAPRDYRMPSDQELQRATQHTEIFRRELSLKPPNLHPPFEENFDRQFEVVLRRKPCVFSFVFGALDKTYMQTLKKQSIYTVGTATTVDEALLLIESGVDAITAQGFEAGGHRGIFDECAPDPAISTLNLVTAIKAVTAKPVIAAGGIMNASDIKKALAAGAQAVQMGTAFLAVKEAGTSSAYRARLSEASTSNLFPNLDPNHGTRLSRAYSGRLARGLINRFMVEVDQDPSSILPFPAQNQFTRDIRAASSARGLSDFLSLWRGTGEGPLSELSAKEFITEVLFR